MRIKSLCVMAMMATNVYAADVARPVVLELFTSQGCSSCPSADALLNQIARDDAGVLPLSMHVDYWDYLGWKDAFSLGAATERQHLYATLLRQRNVYTPQLVVDGTYAVVGSDASAVNKAIKAARAQQQAVVVSITADTKTTKLVVAAQASASMSDDATIYAVRYQRRAVTDVKRGENSGRALQSTNSVTNIETLGVLKRGGNASFRLALPQSGNEGIAVLVQSATLGSVIGAASYAP